MRPPEGSGIGAHKDRLIAISSLNKRFASATQEEKDQIVGVLSRIATDLREPSIVRSTAMTTLALSKDSELAFSVAEQILAHDPDPEVRAGCKDALILVGDDWKPLAADLALKQLQGERSPEVRAAMLEVLAYLAGGKFQNLFTSIANDPNEAEAVRKAAKDLIAE